MLCLGGMNANTKQLDPAQKVADTVKDLILGAYISLGGNERLSDEKLRDAMCDAIYDLEQARDLLTRTANDNRLWK